jgi:hypothetical protein
LKKLAKILARKYKSQEKRGMIKNAATVEPKGRAVQRENSFTLQNPQSIKDAERASRRMKPKVERNF